MKLDNTKIIFMGTPEFAVGSLKILIENGYNVVAVVTQPDKPIGRHGSILRPSPVKQYATEHNIPVLQPIKMKDPDFIENLKSFEADLQVVVAFRMLPEIVWSMPRLGTFNVHASLLPQYRGAAPINWAIINGEKKTGVTTFFLSHDIDTGKIIFKKECPIPSNADVEYLYNILMNLGAEICKETVDAIIKYGDMLPTIEQETDDKLFKKAPKIFKETCEISWTKTANSIYNFIRGLSPIPGAWTKLSKKTKETYVLKIFKAEQTTLKSLYPGHISIYQSKLYIGASDYYIKINELQLSGKKRMKTKDFLNGMKNISDFIAL